ncbi:MAG TPA: hypothetical protein VF258_03330, partial [Luteolibacter sp.]
LSQTVPALDVVSQNKSKALATGPSRPALRERSCSLMDRPILGIPLTDAYRSLPPQRPSQS